MVSENGISRIGINEKAPEFRVKAFHNGEVREISLSDYKGKWVVLFFYPADFSFVCPTELGELADNYDLLKEMDVEVLSVSTDTEYVHKAWHDASETIRKIRFPMLADVNGAICKAYGTYIEEEGLSLRGTFLIDPESILRVIEVHNNDIGRNVEELVRKLKAARHVRENPGEVCPVNWNGGETLKKGMELVGKI
jgi:NADH-dependent peroxiredoxin subunit C